MKRFIGSIFCSLIVSAALAAPARQIHLTVYNNDLAVIHETRTITIPSNHSVSISDVAARIDPSSVKLSIPGASVLEQNYEFDLVGQQKLLERRMGENVDLLMEKGEVVSGKLLTPGAWGIVLETEKGLRLIQSGVQQILISGTAEGLYLRPTLVWLLNGASGEKVADLSYTTGGFQWHAEYIAVLAPTGDKMSWQGWVDITNTSGTSYPDAHLKLIAGDVHRAEPHYAGLRAKGGMDIQTLASDAPQFEERSLFEYHLYELQRPTTINENQNKQISLLAADDVTYRKELRYDIQQGNTKVNVKINFTTGKASNLEQPLPAGRVRLFAAEASGNREFIGEDRIDHTPIGKEVKLTVGNSFDVTAQTTQSDYRQISDRVAESDFTVDFDNAKNTPETVIATARGYGKWSIRDASIEPKKKSATEYEFTITVPAKGKASLTYTQRQG